MQLHSKQQPSILAANFAWALYKFIFLMSYFAIIIKKRVKDLESKLVPDSDFFNENWFDFHVWIHWRSPENGSESQKTNHIFIILISICNRDLNCDILNT